MAIKKPAAPMDEGARAALVRITEMVRLRNLAADDLDRKTVEMKAAAARLAELENEALPALLTESGMKKVTLEDGTEVKVVDEIQCSISAERAGDAHAWLRERGYGAIIKNNVTVIFGKDEFTAADELFVKLIEDYGDEKVQRKETVHPSTLKSFIKERMEAGKFSQFEATDGETWDEPTEVEAGEESLFELATALDQSPRDLFALFGVVPYTIAKIKMPKAQGSV